MFHFWKIAHVCQVEDELDVKKIIGGAGLLVGHINSR